MVDKKIPDREDFKRLLSFVNQEMDMNVRDYKTVFPHLFAKVFEFVKEAPLCRYVPASSHDDVTGPIMESETQKV